MRRFLRQSATWMLKGTLALGLLGPAVPLTAEPSQTDKIIKFFQGRINQDPEDFSNYDRLGTAYLQKGRESGDLVYYELAEKALHKSLELATAEQGVSPRLHFSILVRSSRPRHPGRHVFGHAIYRINPEPQKVPEKYE